MPDFHAYVFYVNRPDLLERSIAAFPYIGPDLTIVDNSTDGGPGGLLVFRPPVPLTYSQSMNWMLQDANRRGVDFIIQFHSDADCSNPNAIQELLEAVRGYRDSGKKWGCAWTFYDILWAINPKAMSDIGGWDTELTSYFTDQDVRRRLNLKGWETIDTHIQGVSHEGSATIRSDKKMEFLNGITFPLRQQYYIQKWGGPPGKERFTVPFNTSGEIF